MDFIKNNILNLIIIGLFLWLMFFSKSSGHTSSKTPDTVYFKHTEYVQQPTQTVPAYQPIIIESRQPLVIPQQYQLPTDTAALKAFCLEIIKKHTAENRYADSTILRDSAGNNVGVFRNNDVVSENMIKQRSPSYTLRFPHTIETMIIKEPADIRRKLFLGPEIGGSQLQLINKAAIGALWEDKKERVYRFSGGVMLPGLRPQFELGRYFKIGFRK